MAPTSNNVFVLTTATTMIQQVLGFTSTTIELHEMENAGREKYKVGKQIQKKKFKLIHIKSHVDRACNKVLYFKKRFYI